MIFLKHLFKKKTIFENPITWDMHNHVLPQIDDGAQSVEDALKMLNIYVELGYKKITATPHIMADYYLNNFDTISEKRNLMHQLILDNQLPLELNFAAEYYVDETLVEQLKNNEPLLTFGEKYILIETSFLSKPMVFEQFVFELISKGYQPILAHPERYVYLHQDYQLLEQLMQNGLKLQINLLSLIGHYSPQVKKLALWMIDHQYYDFLGTDAHKPVHLQMMKEVFKTKAFQKIDFSKIKNI